MLLGAFFDSYFAGNNFLPPHSLSHWSKDYQLKIILRQDIFLFPKIAIIYSEIILIILMKRIGSFFPPKLDLSSIVILLVILVRHHINETLKLNYSGPPNISQMLNPSITYGKKIFLPFESLQLSPKSNSGNGRMAMFWYFFYLLANFHSQLGWFSLTHFPFYLRQIIDKSK